MDGGMGLDAFEAREWVDVVDIVDGCVCVYVSLWEGEVWTGYVCERMDGWMDGWMGFGRLCRDSYEDLIK